MGRIRQSFTRFIAILLSLRDRQHRTLTRQYTPIEVQLREAYDTTIDELQPLIDEYQAGRIEKAVLLTAIADRLDTLTPDILNASTILQNQGAQAGVELGVSAMQAGGMSVQFNRPLVEAVQAALNYVESDAFQAALSKYGSYHAEQIGKLITDALAQGYNPIKTAAQIRSYLSGQRVAPWFDIENLTRTTQLYSAREGIRQSYLKNGIEQWIWIANIGDTRTCMSCYMMHGTIHPVSDLLNDHHRGRCAMGPVTPTWRELGFSRDEPQYETGIQYLERASPEFQLQIMGRGTFEAYRTGRITLSPDLTEEYSNPIFGNMRRRKSLQSILGD